MKRHAFRRAVVFLVAIVFLGGCKSLKNRFQDLASCVRSSPPPPSGPVLALVDGDPITVSEYREFIQTLSTNQKTPIDAQQQRRAVINALIERKMLAHSARHLGLDRDKTYRYKLAEYKQSLLRDLLWAHVGKVTDEEVTTYYLQHQTDYAPPPEIHASRILVRTLADAKKARGLLADGKSFGSVAKAMSIDGATAPQGGQFIIHPHKPITSDTEIAVSAMRMGAVSDIRKVPQGYEILKKGNTQQLPAPAPEQIKANIKTLLEVQKIHLWTETTRKSLEVTIDNNLLNTL